MHELATQSLSQHGMRPTPCLPQLFDVKYALESLRAEGGMPVC